MDSFKREQELIDQASADLDAGNLGNRTEDDIALIFSDRNADALRYVARWSKWLRWNGRVWVEDETLSVFDKIRRLCRMVASSATDKERRQIQAASTVTAVERLARSDRRHAATVDQWDADDWVLNTPGGLVDLRAGKTRPHGPNAYCTKLTAVEAGGECPTWLRFLDEVTGRDDELIGFLQRVAGYACTGSTREHALFFCYGTGGNGKGTFLNAIEGVLSDYAKVASMDVFTESRHDRHPTELADLQGARLVIAQETEEGRRWAEAKIKALTGGDPITARFMRQDFFTFMPKFTLLIAGNHKPALRNVDEAMRRRLHLIPFTVTIPKGRRDPQLAEKLRAEWPGILAWMLDGCAAYQAEGLSPPPAVLEATAEYFSAEDMFQQWLDDDCDRSPDYWETSSALFASWTSYAKAAGEEPGSRKEFSSRIENAGIHPKRRKAGRGYQGIRVKPKDYEPTARDYFE